MSIKLLATILSTFAVSQSFKPLAHEICWAYISYQPSKKQLWSTYCWLYSLPSVLQPSLHALLSYLPNFLLLPTLPLAQYSLACAFLAEQRLTGWTVQSVNMQWKSFVTKTSQRFNCPELNNFSLGGFYALPNRRQSSLYQMIFHLTNTV